MNGVARKKMIHPHFIDFGTGFIGQFFHISLSVHNDTSVAFVQLGFCGIQVVFLVQFCSQFHGRKFQSVCLEQFLYTFQIVRLEFCGQLRIRTVPVLHIGQCAFQLCVYDFGNGNRKLAQLQKVCCTLGIYVDVQGGLRQGFQLVFLKMVCHKISDIFATNVSKDLCVNSSCLMRLKCSKSDVCCGFDSCKWCLQQEVVCPDCGAVQSDVCAQCVNGQSASFLRSQH